MWTPLRESVCPKILRIIEEKKESHGPLPDPDRKDDSGGKKKTQFAKWCTHWQNSINNKSSNDSNIQVLHIHFYVTVALNMAYGNIKSYLTHYIIQDRVNWKVPKMPTVNSFIRILPPMEYIELPKETTKIHLMFFQALCSWNPGLDSSHWGYEGKDCSVHMRTFNRF